MMLQRNEENAVPVLRARRNRTPHQEDRDALLEAKDGTIAELKAQVALLRDELRRKDAVLVRITESIGELSARASEAAGAPPTITPRGAVRAGGPAGDGRWGREGSEKPKLPEGYRVVAVASDAWVLVTRRGVRVAGYRGALDLRRVALDAREHQRRE